MAKGTRRSGANAGASRTTPKQSPNNGPTNDRIAAVLAEYTVLDTSGARVRQQIKTLLDAFDKEGGNRKSLKRLHRSMKLDMREAQAELERDVRYHAGQGIALSWLDNGQGSALAELGPEMKAPDKNTKGARALAAARAHSDGYNAGKVGGVPSNNPYSANPGSEEYVQWHDGRDDGQRDREAANPALRDRIAAAALADASLPDSEASDSPIF
jgi:hypothetical protein